VDELLVEKEEIKGRIAGYRAQLATPEHNDDEHLRLQLKIARLELEINGYAMKLEKAEADGDGVREERYAGLINKTRDNLHDLNQQLFLLQQREERQPNRGNFLSI
jgi:hypothetical protein